jgi:hypothetical protein
MSHISPTGRHSSLVSGRVLALAQVENVKITRAIDLKNCMVVWAMNGEGVGGYDDPQNTRLAWVLYLVRPSKLCVRFILYAPR